jgi:hypothetical protein
VLGDNAWRTAFLGEGSGDDAGDPAVSPRRAAIVRCETPDLKDGVGGGVAGTRLAAFLGEGDGEGGDTAVATAVRPLLGETKMVKSWPTADPGTLIRTSMSSSPLLSTGC